MRIVINHIILNIGLTFTVLKIKNIVELFAFFK